MSEGGGKKVVDKLVPGAGGFKVYEASRLTKSLDRIFPRGSKYPIFEVSGSNPYSSCVLGTETSNIGYLDP